MDKEKLIADIKAMSVLELSELVKALERGIRRIRRRDRRCRRRPRRRRRREEAEEKTEFDVVLKEVGAEKIKVIKVVRELTGLASRKPRTLSTARRARSRRRQQGRSREDRRGVQRSGSYLRNQIRDLFLINQPESPGWFFHALNCPAFPITASHALPTSPVSWYTDTNQTNLILLSPTLSLE